MDDVRCVFELRVGNSTEILHHFPAETPEKRRISIKIRTKYDYITRVANTANQLFITNDLPNVKGIILSGNAVQLLKEDHFDQRLKQIVVTE